MAWSPVLPTAPPLLAVPGWFAVLILSGAGAIPSGEVFGTAALAHGRSYLYPTGIASAQAFGTTTVVPRPVNVTVTAGIPSGEAFGTATVTAPTAGPAQYIFPSGIDTPGGTGGGPLTLTETFTGANSTTSAGANWTNRNAVVGITGNNAYGVTGGAWNIASHNTPMGTDDAEVSMTLGTFSGNGGWDYALLMLGCDSSGRGVFTFLNAAGGQVVICDNTDWTVATYTAAATSGGGVSWTPGTVYKLKRVGNVYTAYLDGVSVVSWTDSGNSIPRDSSHRLVAFGTYNDGAGSRLIDTFTATDAAAGAVAPIGTPTVTRGAAPTQNIFTSGIASGEAFGTTTVVPPTAAKPVVVGTPVTKANAASTIALPTHAVGDLIVIIAVHSSTGLNKPAAGGTVPTWIDIDTPATFGGILTIRTAYCVATATNHTSGSWATSDGMAAIVLRGQKSGTPIGGHIATGASTASGSTSVNAPAITLTSSNGSSFLLRIYTATPLSNTTAWGTVPAGNTRQGTPYSLSFGLGICLNSTDVTTSGAAVAQPCTTGAAASAFGSTIEILAP